jgi:isocitrate lyase
MAGKVLTSTAEHIDRLCAARLQADISGSEMVLISRTDAEAATLIDSNIDPRDTPFIIGEVNFGEEPVLRTFPDAVKEACAALKLKHSAVGPSTQAGSQP